MSDDVALPLEFTDAAANKVKSLIADEDNPNLKLRVYITGGGCSRWRVFCLLSKRCVRSFAIR